MSTGEKAKKGFKMPHLFWIMMGLLLFACLLTYIIPAGEFAVDENGKILGDQFSYLGHQTPVAPWRMFMHRRTDCGGAHRRDFHQEIET